MAENDIITAKKRLQANANVAQKVETNTIEKSAAKKTCHEDSKSVSLPTEKCRKPNPSSSLTVEIPPPMVCATLIYICVHLSKKIRTKMEQSMVLLIRLTSLSRAQYLDEATPSKINKTEGAACKKARREVCATPMVVKPKRQRRSIGQVLSESVFKNMLRYQNEHLRYCETRKYIKVRE